jgi:hypothetical protein
MDGLGKRYISGSRGGACGGSGERERVLYRDPSVRSNVCAYFECNTGSNRKEGELN